MDLDSTPPINATGLGWSESSPHNATTVTAAWTPSVSGDLGSQTITYYTDAICTIAEGTNAALGAAIVTHSFSGGVNGANIYYTITSIDAGTNSATSACSAAMLLVSSPLQLLLQGMLYQLTLPQNKHLLLSSFQHL